MRSLRSRRVLFVALFFLFLALLVVLIGSVNRLQLAPGKPLPSLFVRRSDSESAAGKAGWSLDSARIVSLIYAFVLIYLVSLVVASIFSRRLRRKLLIMSVVALGLFLALMWIKPPEQVDTEGIDLAGGNLLPSTNDNQVRVEIPQTFPPNWAVILTALGAAVIAAGFAALLLVKLYPAFRRRQDDALLTELAKRAQDAADRIRAGADLADAVRRCYKEMSELLCKWANVSDVDVLTPREFAEALRDRGMQDEHVDRLTLIFEQVRYGGRPGIAFADEAVACLDAIRSAYALSVPS